MELTHPDNAISTLLGARVMDQRGHKIGRIRDIHATLRDDGTIVVDSLLVGRHAVVAWSDVLSLGDGVATVRPDL
jgi:sporulation protein YlmC with PRC-barrel domain